MQMPGFGIRPRNGFPRAEVLGIAVWANVVLLVVAAALLYLGADRWWLGTVLAFSPRWLFASPLVVLLPFVLVWRRKLLFQLVAAAVIVVGPIMGWEAPTFLPVAKGALDVRVVTCNVGGDDAKAWQLSSIIATYSPDVVLLQECSGDPPTAWPQGWSEVRAGGLIVASRFPLEKSFVSENDHPPSEWPPVNGLVCRVATPVGDFSVCNVHLRTPREGLTAIADRWIGINAARKDAVERETELRDVESRYLRTRLAEVETPLVVAGDFNMPKESHIYRAHWSDFANAFSQRGWGFGYTKTTRIGGISFGARIDHVLTSSHWVTHECAVGIDVGSDHLPLIADLTLQSASTRE